MKLSYEDKSQILKRLPNLKLPYENIHKKVLSELYYIIPKGKKHLVWFTYIKDKKVCIFIEINPGSKKMIKNLFVVPQTFNKKIVLGTVFYGTLIESKDKKLFSIESIHFYKGKNIVETCKVTTSVLRNESRDGQNPLFGKSDVLRCFPCRRSTQSLHNPYLSTLC